jgi:hypothetical protein
MGTRLDEGSKSLVPGVSRREALRQAACLAGTAVGAGGLLAAAISPAQAQVLGPESTQVVEIHELQAAFHLAKSTQDIDLMMSLWDDNAVFRFGGNTYTGLDQIRTFFLGSGSFTHHRLSLTSSFKIRVDVHGDQADLYFECIDIGNFDTSPVVAGALFAGGTVRHVRGKWLFSDITGGSAFPLSVDHYYFP